MKRALTLTLGAALLVGIPFSHKAQDEKDQQEVEKRQKPQKRQKRQIQPQQQKVDVDVSDEEIKTLVALQQELRPVQMETQKKMRSNVQESELGQQRYMEVRRARSRGENPDLTEEEKEKLNKLQKKNRKAQEEMKSKMKKTVEEKDMEWERFQKVSKAVNQDPELKKRFQEAHREQQGGQQPRKAQPKKKQEAPRKKDGG